MARASQGELLKVKADSSIGGFRTLARLLDGKGRAVGVKLEHGPSRMPVWVLRIETVPQLFISFKTLVSSDEGLPHSLEHLLVGKGTKGRLSELLTNMRLGGHSAATATGETYYQFYAPGIPSFLEQLHQTLDALLKPDFSDLEAEREFFHVAVEDAGKAGLRLIEKGTVYNEMQSNPGLHAYWHALLRKQLGEGHPFTFAAGGVPEAMRGVTPAKIREYHSKFYALGPDTGIILVIPPAERLEPVLSKVRAELDRFSPEKPRPKLEVPEPKPEGQGSLTIVPYPAKTETDPANIAFAWKPLPTLGQARRMLHELFLDSFADGARSNLYAALVDSKTRELDVGATSVSHHSENSHDAKRPIHSVSVGGVRGNRVDEALLDKLRDLIQKKMREAFEWEAGAPGLEDLNRRVRSTIRSWRRDSRVFISSPPGFGFRQTYSGWYRFLLALDEQQGFDRRLDRAAEWKEVDEFLSRPGNIWKELINEGGYLDEMTGSAGVPSPDELAKAEKDKAARLKKRTEEIGDLKDFQAKEAQRSKVLEEVERAVPKPSFMNDPPLTYDEQAKVRKLKIAGRPAMAVAFEGTPFQEAALSFDLKELPARFYTYLPFLPSALRSMGLREGDKITDYRAFSEEVQRDVYGLSVSFDTNPWTSRYELAIQGEGTDSEELAKALSLMKRIMRSNDLSPANLSRIRDVIDDRINSDDQFTKQWEERWIRNPATAFRWQEEGLYLATSSRFTQAHFYHRLKWRFHERVSEEEIQALEKQLLGLADFGLAEAPPAQASKLVAEAFRFLKARVPALPESTRTEDLRALIKEISADLRIGPDRALATLKELQAWVLSRPRVRMELLGAATDLPMLRKGLGELVSELPSGGKKEMAPKRRAWIIERMKSRYPDSSFSYPIYAGLVHSDSVNGNSVISAIGKGQRFSDPSSALEFLSGTLLGGPGPHSLFIKTWEAGLAYSSGIASGREEGIVNYYADRSPNLRSTLKFVTEQTGKIPELKDPWLVDYALAQVFGISRQALGFPERAFAMMANVQDGVTPEKVRRYSRALLALRKRPDLLARLTKKGAERVQSVLLTSPNRELKQKYRSVFFLIAPEAQLAELDAELRAPDRLLRVWPRDFWIDPEGR